MKPLHFIPPVLALMLVGAWTGYQAWSISVLEKVGGTLRGKIAAVTAAGEGSGPRPAEAAGKLAGRAKPIDWGTLAAAMNGLGEGFSRSGIRAVLDFQKRLETLSRDEILTALDEIAALDLTDDERDSLVASLAERLAALDPEALLNRFSDRLGEGMGVAGGTLPEAMRKWAKLDPAAATAWLDRQIASGAFEGKTLEGGGGLRVAFESAALEPLLGGDLQGAAGRMLGLPEDQRREVLELLPFDELTPQQREAYAALVRSYVPEDERQGSFAHMASQLGGEGSLTQVSEFLDSVRASPDERSAAAREAAEKRLEAINSGAGVDRAAVDELRGWLDRQAPGQTDTISGRALAEAAQAGGHLDPGAASELVLEYQRATGSDAMLEAFLAGFSAQSNFEKVESLLDHIQDPVRREELRKRFR